jgi:predicted phosphodiesterase
MQQITRRHFLGTVGAAAALAGAQSLSANGAQDDAPLFSFVIDADPHTGIDRDGELTGRDKFRAVLAKVEQLSPKPDFMLILGDVHGEDLKDVLTETGFKLPIHVVFGNADDSSSRATLRKMFPYDFAETDYYSFTHKNCKFIGICDAIPGDHVGHLSSEFYRGLEQCSWLEGQLAEGRKSCDHTFAFAHIPLHPDGKEANYYLAVNDQRFLKELVLRHEPTALFFGHLHRLEEFTIGKTDVLSVHGSNWTNTLVPPPHDPIGFNVARVYKDGIKLEFVPIDPKGIQ